MRERNDGLYRVVTYLCAKMFDELVITLFSSCGIAAIVFYGVRLQGNFALFWLVYYMTLCIGIGERGEGVAGPGAGGAASGRRQGRRVMVSRLWLVFGGP